MGKKVRCLIATITVVWVVFSLLASRGWSADAGSDEASMIVEEGLCPINEIGEIVTNGGVLVKCFVVKDKTYHKFQYAVIMNEFNVVSQVFRVDTETGTTECVWSMLPKDMHRIQMRGSGPIRGPIFLSLLQRNGAQIELNMPLNIPVLGA